MLEVIKQRAQQKPGNRNAFHSWNAGPMWPLGDGVPDVTAPAHSCHSLNNPALSVANIQLAEGIGMKTKDS